MESLIDELKGLREQIRELEEHRRKRQVMKILNEKRKKVEEKLKKDSRLSLDELKILWGHIEE